MKRRKFIKQSTLGSLSALTFSPALLANQPGVPGIHNRLFVGTPVLPEALYDRGIPESLDAMRELSMIRTVMTFSHDFQFRQYRPGFIHKTDQDGRPLTNIWVRTDSSRYPNRDWAYRDPNLKYADRDILDDLWSEADPRGMEVYVRILEPYVITGAIPGFHDFAEIDAKGNRSRNVCFNHPGYQSYWAAIIEDLMKNHPYLHGFKFGQERGGPILSSLGGSTGTCFCEHCLRIAAKREIRAERARQGLLALQEYGRRVNEDNYKPMDGFLIAFMRILGDFPEILHWEKLWMDSREYQKKLIYKQIKSMNPSIQVGWHIDHGMTWDLVTRTFWDYAKMGPYSDWLSVAVYFDSMGRRSLNHFNKFYRDILFADANQNLAYAMYLNMLGFPPENQPELSEHLNKDTSFSSDYVYRECNRAVKAVNGDAKVHARIGFDMPGYDCIVRPKEVFEAVGAALKAGVDGLWCGREWDEIKPENAKAFGDAIRNYINQQG